MNYVIGIFKDGAQEARPFAQKLLSDGHEISQVFFYKDGVLNNISDWTDLNISLLFCEAACARREIKQAPQGTLTQFFNALIKADRYVIFG